MQPTQDEKNESLGTFIKRSREGKNVSIEQVAYATRISLKMLRSLEDDDHRSLPAPTFVRGYLQAYAKYVRLDTQDLLLRYQHHLATAPDSKRGAIRSHYLYVRERYQEKRRLVLVITLFALLLTIAGAYFFLKAQREKRKHLGKVAEMIQKSEEAKPLSTATATDKTAPVVAAIETIVVKEITKPSEPAPAPTPVPTPTPPKPPVVMETKATEAPKDAPSQSDQKKQFNLLLRASEDVWLRFQTDDDEVKDLTLRSGKSMMLRADKVVKVFSGNLNAMKATLNGKELPPLANAKGVKSVVLPEYEANSHPLPLFPQFQVKPPTSENAPRNSTPITPRRTPVNNTEPPAP